MIDRGAQGKGFAPTAVSALQSNLPTHYPARHAVVLTVNFKNSPAVRCYLKGGFQDTGGIYPHRLADPRHILRMALPRE
ncbi:MULTISPECIES: hypothetical protein [unclassified Phaeobacter]|uniref:hypothetical protein n=1 Tax=unclassified Phaeobacter TaxID=2621772 RepID=UPI003A8454A9